MVTERQRPETKEFNARNESETSESRSVIFLKFVSVFRKQNRVAKTFNEKQMKFGIFILVQGKPPHTIYLTKACSICVQ